MLNKVQLIGHLGRDPELRKTNSGKSVGQLSVATSSGTGDKKKTEWHRVITWDKTAENCKEYLTKGRMVFVEGRIQSREWEKDGEKKTTYEIIAYDVKFLGGNDKGSSKKPSSKGSSGQDWGDDDIPF